MTEFDGKYGYDSSPATSLSKQLSEVFALEAEPPLKGKRRDFRSVRTGPEMLGIETQPTSVARLPVHGMAFGFGAPSTPQPDRVLRDLGLGIEITHRMADPSWDLRWHLKKIFQSRSSSPRITRNKGAAPLRRTHNDTTSLDDPAYVAEHWQHETCHGRQELQHLACAKIFIAKVAIRGGHFDPSRISYVSHHGSRKSGREEGEGFGYLNTVRLSTSR